MIIMGLIFIKVSRQVKLLDKMGTKKKSLPVDFNRLMSHQCILMPFTNFLILLKQVYQPQVLAGSRRGQ